MVLIGLLLIALVCLALGLVLASAGWLIGSLAASAAAAWVLWRGRDRIVAVGAPAEAAKPAESAKQTEAAPAGPQTANAVATSAPSRDAAVADTPAAADYARRRADELSGTAQPAAGAPSAAVATETELVDVDVWVIDGRPNYHTAHCGVLLGAEPETIPHSQAVEDGFTPCTLCDPDAHPERAAATGAAQQPPAAADVAEPGDLRQVWVVDGWPYYHAQGCNRLVGAEPEPIPFGQAVEDGFTACPTCQPAVIEPAPAEPAPVEATASEPTASEPTASELTTSELATSEVVPPEPVTPEPVAEAVVAEPAVAEQEPVANPDPEPAAEVPVAEPEPAVVEPEPEPAAAEAEATDARADVWVVPGRPRFHVQGCMIIGDQDAIAVPYTQAIDDGFKPCSLCEPV